MEEARRYFRFIAPGFVAIIEFLALVWLSQLESPKQTFTAVNDVLGGNGLTVALSAVAASGVLGYALSLVHHLLSHTILWMLGPDYRKTIAKAAERWIELISIEDGQRIESSTLSTDGAWRVLTALWFGHFDKSDSRRIANKRTDDLADLYHGAGAQFYGAIGAVVLWQLCWWVRICSFRVAIDSVAALAFAIVAIHFLNFRRLRGQFQRVVEMMFMYEIEDVPQKTQPARIWVASADLTLRTRCSRWFSRCRRRRGSASF